MKALVAVELQLRSDSLFLLLHCQPDRVQRLEARLQDAGYTYIHKELQSSGVSLNLLWLEYCDQCRAAGEIPYQSTQFNKYYTDYLAKANATMHLNHKPGEIM